jgi:hypothetical protein
MFAWVLANPVIAPIISLGIVVANLFKAYRTYKITKYELSIDRAVLKNNRDENSLSTFKETQKKLYTAQKEVVINSILTIASVISVFGVFFPPLLIVGMGLAVTGSVLGILDNKFQFGIKILKFLRKPEDTISNTKKSMNKPNISNPKNSHYFISKQGNFNHQASISKTYKSHNSHQTSYSKDQTIIKNIFTTIKNCKQEKMENKKNIYQSRINAFG